MERLTADSDDRLLGRVPKMNEYYNTWALLFKAHLVKKNLAEPLEESAPPAREAAAVDICKRKNKKTLSQLTLGVTAEHLCIFSEATTSRSM